MREIITILLVTYVLVTLPAVVTMYSGDIVCKPILDEETING